MRFANLNGRAAVIAGDAAVDAAGASGGRFPADPQAVLAEWDAFRDWAAALDAARDEPFAVEDLGPPLPRPAQVFAIGINYAEHAHEAGYPPESAPVTFTKFPSCLTGPVCDVELPSGTVDWEVEMVVAVARDTVRVRLVQPLRRDHAERAHLGNDLRRSRAAGPALPGLPAVPRRPHLHRDSIFTGTPSGVGNARTPKRFIRPGEVLVSELEGVGRLTQRFVAARENADRGVPSPPALR